MSEIMVRERFLRSGKKVYEYSFEMASVDGKRKRKSKSGFASKRDARIAGRKALSEYENSRLPYDRDRLFCCQTQRVILKLIFTECR